MKLTLAVLSIVSCAAAFSTPATFSRGVSTSVASEITPRTLTTSLFAEPEEKEEEEGFDLNLEEMFDIFDAADKDKDFDATVKKVKGA
mmetsp:Transcript_3478/g.6363  ORF Transcript_3478/g.6363 Transcript_3478/m.6363 type:complete len:88 (+) Transcript_3478:143-406(+)|eukprot:CAMPEP_0198280100 /NCGR_PEP_ID=MMETSP1449-20131203/256_1 /TAXON_ID=420275 /ORGANISM="Attheya septentrionalis, Strain CCMP2084" /LENGTH=87 /DNA_ID=CAMNT_0043975373 /DNA_START=114 /DNA_END=377 /DNA_ORIENTATION=+